MAIHDARILQLSELLAGDIIIEYEDSPEHSMLWVGGGKPLVHSADSGTTSGIVQQSARGFGEGDTPFAEVYRCRNQHLAHKVSDIAQRFAVVTTDPRYVTAKKSGWNVGLKTRFSQNRLGGNGGVWGPEAIVRAVRAYYRALKTSVLSPSEGVTCSQFVTYSFSGCQYRNSCNKTSTNQISNRACCRIRSAGTAQNSRCSAVAGCCSCWASLQCTPINSKRNRNGCAPRDESQCDYNFRRRVD